MDKIETLLLDLRMMVGRLLKALLYRAISFEG